MQRVLTFQDMAFGDAKKIEGLFLTESEVNQTIYVDGSGVTPLAIAVEFGRTDMVDVLLKSGAKTNISDHDGVTPLLKAIRYDLGEEESKEEKKPDLPARLSYGEVVEMVGVLLSAKDAKNVLNKHDNLERYALLDASSRGYSEIVTMLINYEANLDVVDDQRFTALMLAAQEGYLTVVRLLLDAGAEINAIDAKKRTALLIAGLCGQLEIADELLFRQGELDDDVLNTLLDECEVDADILEFLDKYQDYKIAKEEYPDVKEQIKSIFLGQIDEQAHPTKTSIRSKSMFFLPASIVRVIEEYACPVKEIRTGVR